MRPVSIREVSPPPRICVAIDQACEESGMTNAAIGEALGHPNGVNVGRWRARNEPSRDDLARLEKVLQPQRRLGWINAIAGYNETDEASDLLSMIDDTSLLNEGWRKIVRSVTLEGIQATAEERDEQEAWRRKTASTARRSRRS